MTTRPGSTTPAARQPRRARVAWGAALGSAVSLSLAACASGADAGSPPAAQSPAVAPQLGHIHGLGVDPEDGTLVIGSHEGIYTLTAGAEPVLVSEVQDFMGFTVVGPRRYLASGHPGAHQDGPGAVGLLESTDGGATWQTLSLAGEADFHALDARGDRVYGLNSMTGALAASDDAGATWSELPAPPLADVTVSPDGADTLIITTEQGPALSTDGGATFAVIPGAPVVIYLDWAPDGALVGLDPEGGVHRSLNQGATWEATGRLGAAPEGLDAASADLIYAAAGGAVLESTDGGASFEILYRAD